jgi:betaine-aldehyde dehydrogenase
MRDHERLFIGGEWVEPASSRTIDVISPHSEELVGQVPEGTEADIDRAVASARDAFDNGEWPRLSPEERIAAVQKFSEVYAAHIPDMAAVITEEMGSPISFSNLAQSPAPWMMLNTFLQIAAEYPWEERRQGVLGSDVVVRREPAGVVGAIVPWNVPQFVIMSKLAPALIAGCTIVVKPSPETPLDAFLMADLLDEAGIPKGVVSVIPAGREVGEHLVRHTGVDKIAFTGSTAAGRRIASICGEQLKRVSLELGGKSAAIILDDADLDAVLPTVIGISAGTSQGESCVCMSRILAPRSRYDEIAEKLTAGFASLKVGDPHEDDTVVGPLISAEHRERVLGYVRKGVEEGATLAFGGKVPEHLDKGFYVEPTLLTDVSNDMTVAQEEIFGPVIALIPFDDDEDAIRIANDSRFGLAGCVFTGDPSRGWEIARRVKAGTFSVNTYSADFNSPFGGYKESGIGREHGPTAIEEYLQYKTISVAASDDIPSPAPAQAVAAA